MFQSITARPIRKCPACGKTALQRLIGPGAGLIFRGSGFYITDYRSESYKQAAKAESDAACGGTDKKTEKASEDKAAGSTKTDAKKEKSKKAAVA